MFDFIRGFVASKQPEYVVIDVGGVGFKIFTSMTSLGGCEEGETATFFTYLSVKEDDITLFGFTSSQELDTFKMLLDVSGVGPKLAVSVLSQMTVTDFSMAVASGNHKTLSKLKGIGPKTAQRIVLELKDKISSRASTENVPDSGEFAAASIFGSDPVFDEAVEALMVLGYNQQKARAQVGSVYRSGMQLEQVVKDALAAGR
ncbi:MAG: Holliday junction branch migration protein RuvA [Clostridia bacterium]|nr:Holliday junction branch migration protein RuvA [Clostridia bacterium]